MIFRHDILEVRQAFRPDVHGLVVGMILRPLQRDEEFGEQVRLGFCDDVDVRRCGARRGGRDVAALKRVGEPVRNLRLFIRWQAVQEA